MAILLPKKILQEIQEQLKNKMGSINRTIMI